MSATYHISHYQTVAAVEARHFWFRARNAMLAALIGRFLPERQRRSFLEIGCGTGIVLRVLHELGFRVTGLDVNDTAIRYATVSCPAASLIRQSVYAYKGSHRYGAIGAFDVLEHQTRDRLFLKRCWDLLEEDGMLFLTVPAGMWLWNHMDQLGGHKRRYEAHELSEKVRTAGFSIQYMNYWNFLALPWYILFRLFTIRQTPASVVGMYLHVPHGLVNALLYGVLRMEQSCMFIVPYPFGATLVVAAKKVAV